MSELKEIITDEIAKWRDIPYMELNSAKDIMEEFSEEFAERLIDEYDYEEDIDKHVYDTGGFSHTVVKYNNKYYDAECVEGVYDINKIPRIQRQNSTQNVRLKV